MTIPVQRSFPYDGSSGGDAGPYDADYFAAIQQAYLGAYTRRTTAGVLLGVGDGTNESLLVTETSPQSLGVKVFTGWAMVNGRMYQLTSDTTVSITQNTDGSGNNRIDSIILRLNLSTNTCTLVDLQGTVAASPVAPTLTQTSTVWEIRLANVTVINLATTITNADIDTTARSYAVKRLVKEGGTGLQTIALGQMLMADAADSFAAVPAVGDFNWLIGDTAKSPRARFVSMRPHVIGGSAATTTIGTSAAGTTLGLDSPAISNPDSFISSIAGNQFFLTSGYYLVSAVCVVNNTSGATGNVVAWIHNATTNTPLIQGTTFVFGGTPVSGGNMIIPPQIIQSNGTDAFELRSMRSGGGAGLGAPAGTLTPTSGYASVPRMIHIQKIKI